MVKRRWWRQVVTSVLAQISCILQKEVLFGICSVLNVVWHGKQELKFCISALKSMYLFSFFLNWANTFFHFIYSVYKFKYVRENKRKNSLCACTWLFFMLELSSLASFCSWASILLALQKFDLALEIAILRALSLCKSHRAYYFIQTVKFLSLMLHVGIYTSMWSCSV